MPITATLSAMLSYCPVFLQIDPKLVDFVKIDRMYIRASVCLGICLTPWNSVLMSDACVLGTKNHADNYHLVARFLQLTSFSTDRSEVGSLCENRSNVHTCQCVFGHLFDPLEFGSILAR